MNVQDYEPSDRFRQKAKKYALTTHRETYVKGKAARSLRVTFHSKEKATLKFKSRQEFKAYRQAVENISTHEDTPVRIHESLRRYMDYEFIPPAALSALNHRRQVVIADTLYRLRGNKQISVALKGGNRTVATIEQMKPSPANISPGDGGGNGGGGNSGNEGSKLGQCVEIIGWKNSYESVTDTNAPCMTGGRQTQYEPEAISLPDGAITYAGDPIESIRIHPVNMVGPGEDGFLGQTNRTASAHTKVVLRGQANNYLLGVDDLKARKLAANVVLDIRVTVAQESCYFGYCYCTSGEIINDERRVIAETDVGTSFKPINTTGSNAGPYAVSALVDDRCGGKGVTSWHGIEVDGRAYPTYYDGRLFSRPPGSAPHFNHENGDPIFKLRGGCGKNHKNCGARPDKRL